jgi:hypothetical protein
LRADCIRVTHPCATLGQILLFNLPFGLHVLGLPLAFILSQDQTLHSIFFNLAVTAYSLSNLTALITFALVHLSSASSLLVLSYLSIKLSSNRLHLQPLSIAMGSAINFHLFNERYPSLIDGVCSFKQVAKTVCFRPIFSKTDCKGSTSVGFRKC